VRGPDLVAVVRGLTRVYPPLYPELPPTDHQIGGAITAAHHLIAHDLPPIFAVGMIRQIWKRDRRLALRLARIRGVLW